MAETTNIEWAHSTFNPWMGCAKVAPECLRCYAEELMDTRYGKAEWGAGKPRVRTSESYWRQPYTWNRKAGQSGQTWRVFCASLADVFENNASVLEWREELFKLIWETPNLTWMLLTKRPDFAVEYLRSRDNLGILPPNIWLGASAGTQETLDMTMPHLLRAPSKIPVKFLSCEPLLEEIDLGLRALSRVKPDKFECLGTVQWVITGGESGAKARKCNLAWLQSIYDQCQDAGVPCFTKQLGSVPVTLSEAHGTEVFSCSNKGGNPSEWPTDFRWSREFPTS